MSVSSGISRRNFFKLAGGGIVVLLADNPLLTLAQGNKTFYPEDFNAYLVVGETGRVKVFSGKIEMGQGVLTSQAQMVAEELGVSLDKIHMILGDTDQCPFDMGTFGSLTTRMFGPALRAAAAQARLVLVTLASTRLGVDVDQLTVKDGIVFVAGEPDRRVSYGSLSHGAKIAQVVDHKAVLRAATDFHVMGTSPKRLDAVEKVTGTAKYAADISLPGMLYARILRPPMHGAKLSKLDTSEAISLPGVVVVNRDDLVAVLHADPEIAGIALGKIKADWSLPDAKLDTENIHAHLIGQLTEFKSIAGRGDVESAHATAAQLFDTHYYKGYVAHAPLETHAALAEIKDGKATVWASTQTPFPTRDRIAKTLGFEQKNVRVITPFLGGGFGGKSADGQAVEAARLAQITGKPVQVAWTRAEEFFYDRFDPAAVANFVSGIDNTGKIVLWDYQVLAAGERGSACVYDIPNLRIRSGGQSPYEASAASSTLHPFATGPWRAPGANMNVFAIESQLDIMAAAVGVDPLAFRMRHLSDPRMRRVLQAAAVAFGWSPAVGPSRRGVGIACNIDAGTYVATMAEVKVDASTGRVTVVRVACAQDMGVVVNPDGAKMQIEGGITMGLGYAVSEEVRFHGGEILDRNFDTYQIPRFSWVPKIDIVLVKNDELAPQGGGEPSITTTGAVLANAIFDATGVRMFRLPMSSERLRAAISAKGAHG